MALSFRSAIADQAFELSAERLIAFGRLVLGAFALAAIHVDPIEPTEHAPIARLIVIGYLCFAVWRVTVVVARRPGFSEQVLAHIIDILSVSLLMYLNRGATSPFFVFFTFILLSATLRWNGKGAIATTALLGLAFLFLLVVLQNPSGAANADDLGRSIMRAGYLMVAGTMLGYVGAFQERNRSRFAQLAAWPGPDQVRDGLVPIKSALAHAAGIMGVPRMLVIWEQSGEPFRHVALWSADRFTYTRERPDRFGNLVRPTLANVTIAYDATASNLVKATKPGVTGGAILDRDLEEAFSIQHAVSAPFRLPVCQGRIFLLDGRTPGEHELILAELIATRIGVDLEHFLIRTELETAAASNERARLARDLHDGVLQGLAAANIQLKLSSADVDEAVAGQLNQTRQLLAEEQHRIRSFVEASRSVSSPMPPMVELLGEVGEQLRRFNEQWGCAVRFTVDPLDLRTRPHMAAHVRYLLGEAVSNAVRHGNASHVNIAARAVGDLLRLTITDNGSGFPELEGFYSEEALARHSQGPASLRARTMDLSGRLRLQTSKAGSTIEIEVPL